MKTHGAFALVLLVIFLSRSVVWVGADVSEEVILACPDNGLSVSASDFELLFLTEFAVKPTFDQARDACKSRSMDLSPFNEDLILLTLNSTLFRNTSLNGNFEVWVGINESNASAIGQDRFSYVTASNDAINLQFIRDSPEEAHARGHLFPWKVGEPNSELEKCVAWKKGDIGLLDRRCEADDVESVLCQTPCSIINTKSPTKNPTQPGETLDNQDGTRSDISYRILYSIVALMALMIIVVIYMIKIKRDVTLLNKELVHNESDLGY